MGKIFSWILRHGKAVLIMTAALTLCCAALALFVNVNYSMQDYLPDDTGSMEALKVMERLYPDGLPNCSVYVPDIGVAKALEYKERFAKADGVRSVLWLDDVADIKTPLEVLGSEVTDPWYRDGGALFMISVDMSNVVQAVASMREIAGDGALLSGEAVKQSVMQDATMSEVARIILFVIPLVLLVLLVTTSSFFESVLFIAAIGVAIIINEGTNAFLGSISFVTQATGAILQLAVSMDYAVFLLHRFKEFRDDGLSVHDAMLKAMTVSSSTIAASAMTTVFGFLALTLMDFRIGPDMGIVLAKGVFLSYLSVMVFLPVLASCTSGLIERTRHRQLLPSFQKVGRFSVKICAPLAIVIAILIGPCFIAQNNNRFIYGSSAMHSADSDVMQDEAAVMDIFGETQQMVLLVPKGDPAREALLCRELSQIENIASVTSYATAVGVEIPDFLLSESQLSAFRSDGYTRVILYASTDDESAEAFAAVKSVRNLAAELYGEWYLIGQNAINYDLMKTITGDTLKVLLCAAAAIYLVMLLAFREPVTPALLLFTIESAVFLNMSLPYFLGDSLNYIGYQIISAVQLGATVDYGILLTSRYLESRATLGKRESVQQAVSKTTLSILTPVFILILSGVTLYLISTNGVISQMGGILAIGTGMSAVMVLFFLPALLMLFDNLVTKKKKGIVK